MDTPTSENTTSGDDNAPAALPARIAETATDPELAERVVTEVERLLAHQKEPDRLKLWRRIADYRDWLCDMVDQWDDMGRRDVADQCRERLRKLDAVIDVREPSPKRLRAMVDGHRIATESDANVAVLAWMNDRDNGDARQLAESLLSRLRHRPVNIEDERTKVLVAIAECSGDTSHTRKNKAKRIVYADY